MMVLLRRAAAAAIDIAAGSVLCLLLSTSVGLLLSARAVPAFEIGSPDTIWRGPIPMLISIYGRFFYGLPFALFLVWLNEPITGVALGKLPLRLRVVTRDGERASAGRLWKRTLVKTSGLWLFTLALIAGRWELVVLSAAVGSVAFLGCFLALGPTRRALHDRLAGTRVVQGPLTTSS